MRPSGRQVFPASGEPLTATACRSLAASRPAPGERPQGKVGGRPRGRKRGWQGVSVGQQLVGGTCQGFSGHVVGAPGPKAERQEQVGLCPP